ncbi:MAG: seryl-tRNA synthetase [Bacteroidales bacterium]|jgi:seryl-tRNA synthetase|nr:seryl-tRNA synthetase [Bacteroidales bacterium]
MLTLRFIQENRDFIIERLKIKNFDATKITGQILALDKERRSTQAAMDDHKAELNKLSKEIGKLFKNGKVEEATKVKEKNAQIKENIKEQSESLNKIEEQLNLLLVQLPNIPHESVPPGKGEQDNVEIKSGGTKPELAQDALPHWDLAKKYDIIDFELGNKITGSGFPVYKGKGAKLQRALINYFLDKAIEAGYHEVLPPLMVNEDSGFGTGQLPDKEGQMYHVALDNLYLIPTAEVPVTNIYRNKILSAKDFPIRMTAYTPCFRREAGSYGKDVRGLNRLHQFDKVEIVQIQHPDKSYETLQEMLNHVESLVKSLNLPYRILKLCGGDISFTSALTYDFEVYSAAQQKWLEVSSVSNFEAFQANRLKLRFKEEGEKKTKLAHTLNGSALALPRILAALLENNQSAEGVVIPEVLRPYTGFDIID